MTPIYSRRGIYIGKVFKIIFICLYPPRGISIGNGCENEVLCARRFEVPIPPIHLYLRKGNT